MPTYDEEVLTDTPLAYFKLDEPEGSSIALDSSGNDLDGELLNPSNPNANPLIPLVYGVSGPIETDSPNVGMSGGVARAPADASLDTVNEFTWEVWGFNSATPTVGTAVLLTRSNAAAGTGGTHIRINGQTVTAAIRMDSTGTTVWDLQYGGLPWGAWFHIVLTRNSNVLRLYVNGLLRDERTDLPTDTVTLAEDRWGISADPTGPNSGSSWGAARAAFYAVQHTASRIRIRYEAALASLPVSATITIRVVVELDTDQVDPIDFPFLHNFGEPLSGSPRPITEHLSYATNVLQSEPDYQQRINAQPHHVERTLEYFVTPTSARARAMMQAALWTPGQTYKLPIAKDWGTLTAQADPSDGTLSLDTTLRDYEIGSYVAVWENVYQPWTAQFFEITSRTDVELGISPVVGSTLPIGSTVAPARLAILPDDDLSIDSHLIDRETAALQFEILSTELSTRRLAEYTPAETYLDIEVFDLERVKVEWVDLTQYQVSRRKQGTGNPTGNDYQRAIDTGSPQTIPLRVLLTTRAAQAEFYGWLDARQGRQNPVWLISEESDLNVIARDGAFIVIDYIGYTELYNVHSARRHIAFKKTDGSLVYKMITASVNNGDGTETLSVSTPPLLADIVKTSFLRLCTAPDQFELVHHRDGQEFITECSFVMTELLTTPEPD